MENEFVKRKDKKAMDIVIKYPGKLQVIAEGDTEFCSCIAKTTFYYIGVKDWNVEKQEYKEIKDTPQVLKEKLDQSPRAKKPEKYHVWSEEEIKILKDNYNSIGINATVELLPNLSRKKIISKAHKIGITGR